MTLSDWIYIGKFADPPIAPKGFKTKVKRDSFFGIVIAYRFVKEN